MADDTEIASINDGLAEAMATIPAEPLEPQGEQVEDKAPPPAAPEDGPRRDDHGRFAPKEEDAPAAPEEERDGGQVPSWRMREIREERDRMAQERDAYRRQAWELEQRQQAYLRQQQEAWQAQQQQQFQPPDPYDPQAYHQYWQSELDRRQHEWNEREINRYVQFTFELEEEKDPPAFKKAYAAVLEVAKGNPQLANEVRLAPNPGKALMGWYRQHTVMTEIGNDPDGWKQRQQESWENDPEVQKRIFQKMDAQARGNGRSSEGNVSNLPSVNRAPGGAGRQQLGSLGSTDREIFESLSRKR